MHASFQSGTSPSVAGLEVRLVRKKKAAMADREQLKNDFFWIFLNTQNRVLTGQK